MKKIIYAPGTKVVYNKNNKRFFADVLSKETIVCQVSLDTGEIAYGTLEDATDHRDDEDEDDVELTDWRTVKEGTPVLFRRDHHSAYTEGTWYGGSADYGWTAGVFYWDVDSVSGLLSLDIGARVAENGEWHINPFWCKLK